MESAEVSIFRLLGGAKQGIEWFEGETVHIYINNESSSTLNIININQLKEAGLNIHIVCQHEQR